MPAIRMISSGYFARFRLNLTKAVTAFWRQASLFDVTILCGH